MSAGQPAARPRSRLLTTSSGTNLEAFGVAEWSLLALIALIWGSSFVLMEIGLESLRPGLITLLRVGLGAAALALVPRARRTRIAREDLPRVAVLGVVWIGVPLLLFPLAQQWIDSSVAGMLNGAMPLAAVAWTALLARTAPGRMQALGLSVGFLGIVAISLPKVPMGGLGTLETMLGVALALTAASMYGLAATLVTPLQQRYGSLPVLHRAQGAAVVFVAPFALWGVQHSSFSWPAMLAMLPLGILSTALAFIAIATLIGRVGAPRGAVAVYLVPIVSIALGVILLGEQVHPFAYLGAALVIVGAWLTSRREAAR